MSDSNQRKYLEATLRSAIHAAQGMVQSNPHMKQMIEKLRNLYMDDQENFLFALGAAPPPTSLQKRPVLPPSKIPQLIYILNAVSTGKPITLPPSWKNPAGELPVELSETTLQIVLPQANSGFRKQSIPPSPARRAPRMKQLEEIEKIKISIQEVQMLYQQIKQDENRILSRKGKYAIAVERLKAERLLRELPGTLEQLEQKRRILEEQYESSSVDRSESL